MYRKMAIGAAMAALMTVASVAKADPQAPISTKSMTLNIGDQHLTPTWSTAIILGAKLYKPYLPNITIETFDTLSGMPLVNNMLAGRIDIAVVGDMPAIVLGSKSGLAKTRFLAVSEGDDGEEAVFYVKNDSPIKDIKDLEGKTVSTAFGSFAHRFTEVVAKKDGIKFNFVGQSPEVGLSNLQAGKVDAFVAWNPYGRLVPHRGYGRRLMDGSKYGFSSFRGVVASQDFIDKHPDVLLGWLRAELDAHKMMRERPDECAKILFEHWKKYNVPLEVIRPDFDYKKFPDVIEDKWKQVMIDSSEFLLQHKLIDKAPDWSTFIDDSFLKKAAALPSALK